MRRALKGAITEHRGRLVEDNTEAHRSRLVQVPDSIRQELKAHLLVHVIDPRMPGGPLPHGRCTAGTGATVAQEPGWGSVNQVPEPQWNALTGRSRGYPKKPSPIRAGKGIPVPGPGAPAYA